MVYTLKETYQLLRFSRTKMWKLIKDRKISSFNYPDSNRIYFHYEEIQRFLSEETKAENLKPKVILQKADENGCVGRHKKQVIQQPKKNKI